MKEKLLIIMHMKSSSANYIFTGTVCLGIYQGQELELQPSTYSPGLSQQQFLNRYILNIEAD